MKDDLIDIGKLSFDMRAEVLARLLTNKHDLSIEQILFKPKNHFQRLGVRDVLSVSKDFSFNLDKETLWIDVSREGIFDILPESIFFPLDDDYFDDNVSQAKKLNEAEATARQFLLPFEQLFYWLRIENEYREYNIENHISKWWQSTLFASDDYSPFKNSNLAEEIESILIHILPHLNDIVGNWLLTEQWLSFLLNTSIKILTAPPIEYALPENLQKRLGNGTIGQDFIIGNTFFDGIPSIKIFIKDLTPTTLTDYLLGSVKRKLLAEELLSILLPLETPYEIIIDFKTQSNSFQIEKSHDNSILGYTTIL